MDLNVIKLESVFLRLPQQPPVAFLFQPYTWHLNKQMEIKKSTSHKKKCPITMFNKTKNIRKIQRYSPYAAYNLQMLTLNQHKQFKNAG